MYADAHVESGHPRTCMYHTIEMSLYMVCMSLSSPYLPVRNSDPKEESAAAILSLGWVSGEQALSLSCSWCPDQQPRWIQGKIIQQWEIHCPGLCTLLYDCPALGFGRKADLVGSQTLCGTEHQQTTTLRGLSVTEVKAMVSSIWKSLGSSHGHSG